MSHDFYGPIRYHGAGLVVADDQARAAMARTAAASIAARTALWSGRLGADHATPEVIRTELDPAGPVVIYGRPLQWRSPSKVVTERGIEYTESFSGPGNLVQPCAPPLVLSHGGDIPGGPPVLSARTTVLPDALGLSLRWELREDLHPATVAFLTSQVLPLSVSFRECHPDGSEYRQSRYSSRPHRLPRRALIFHVAVVAAPAYPRAATLPPAA